MNQSEHQENRGAPQEEEALVIPLLAEELDVHKRTVETGGVRIIKTVREREEILEEALRKEEVDVERVTINRIVEAPVSVRQEGDTLIVPLLEEVLVVEKRLLLREELHITRRAHQTRETQRVRLRSEEATVERVPTNDSQEAV